MAARKKAARRGRHAIPGHERKSRLIQTRVAADLEGALRKQAREKRVTVSQLIRNVLEDSFQLVDDLVSETASLTETMRRDAMRIAASARGLPNDEPEKRAVEQVFAWQEVRLNQRVHCARCETSLARGEPAMLGLCDDPRLPRVFLCAACGQQP